MTRTVKADRRTDYEAWLRRFLADAESCDGFAGADVPNPSRERLRASTQAAARSLVDQANHTLVTASRQRHWADSEATRHRHDQSAEKSSE